MVGSRRMVFMNHPGSCIDERNIVMTRRIIGGMSLMGLVGLEVCQWRIGVPLVIVWVLLMGLGGLLWAMVDFFGDDYRAGGTWPESTSPDHYDGEEPHLRASCS